MPDALVLVVLTKTIGLASVDACQLRVILDGVVILAILAGLFRRLY
jgi:hypothetical protein